MNLTFAKNSRATIGAALCLLFAPFALAATDPADVPTIKVLKVKGNQAIVIFSKKAAPLSVGQVGQVIPKTGGEAMQGDLPSRDNFIGLEMSLGLLSSKADGASTESKADRFDLNVIYGWNKEKFEYGPLLQYSFEKQSTIDIKTLEVGGLFDFNFKPNTTENESIVGLRLIAAVGQQDNSAQTKAASTMRIEPGVFFKWFGFSTNLAAIASMSYRIAEVSLDSAKSKTTGLVGHLGIQAYF